MDLRDYRIEDLHRQIGVIFQDFLHYEMTAHQNIAMGSLNEADESAVRDAAGKSGADQVIEGLPDGYAQLLGRRFEAVSTFRAANGRK